MCNTWGNIWTWIFGSAMHNDETTSKAYITYSNYDYTSPNWATSESLTASELTSGNYNYTTLAYNLPRTINYCRYMGTDLTSGNSSIIGMPTSSSSTASDSSGISDYFYTTTSTSYTFGLLRGGASNYTTRAGLFNYHVSDTLAYTYAVIGFRPSLIL